MSFYKFIFNCDLVIFYYLIKNYNFILIYEVISFYDFIKNYNFVLNSELIKGSSLLKSYKAINFSNTLMINKAVSKKFGDVKKISLFNRTERVS